MLVLLGSGQSIGQTRVVFRDGESPPGYAGTRDVRIHNGANVAWDPNTNYDEFRPDISVDGAPIDQTALVRWDLSSIPTTANVTSVWIELDLQDGSGETFNLYRCGRPWVEAEATWNQAANGLPWETGGARGLSDRNPLSMGQLIAPSAGKQTLVVNNTGLSFVRQWVSDPSSNLGVILENYTVGDGIKWSSSEAPQADARPKLVVVTSSDGMFELQNGTDTEIANGPNPQDLNWDGHNLYVWGGAIQSSALLSFDLSSIPKDARVLEVSLLLHVHDDSSAPLSVYELRRPWVETAATWKTYDGVNAWAEPGTGSADRGDLVATFTPTGFGAHSFPLGPPGAQLVEAWISGATPNRGFQIVGFSTVNADDASFADRDAPPPLPPGLAVTYVLPDAGVDAGVDAGLDAGADAGSPTDGGTSDAGTSDAGTTGGPELSLRIEPGAGGLRVGSTARVEIVTTHTSSAPLSGVWLRVAAEGLRLREARLDEQPAASSGDSVSLGTLVPGQASHVTWIADVTGSPGTRAKVTATLGAEARELETRSEELPVVAVGIDVGGCGCRGGGAPPAAWGLLLLALRLTPSGRPSPRRRARPPSPSATPCGSSRRGRSGTCCGSSP